MLLTGAWTRCGHERQRPCGRHGRWLHAWATRIGYAHLLEIEDLLLLIVLIVSGTSPSSAPSTAPAAAAAAATRSTRICFDAGPPLMTLASQVARRGAGVVGTPPEPAGPLLCRERRPATLLLCRNPQNLQPLYKHDYLHIAACQTLKTCASPAA